MTRPKSTHPRHNQVMVCLNDETLELLDRARSDTPRSAYLRRLLLLAVGPVFDDEQTEHVIVRLTPADLGHVQMSRKSGQSEREYILDLIRADAEARRPAAPAFPLVGPPKP